MARQTLQNKTVIDYRVVGKLTRRTNKDLTVSWAVNQIGFKIDRTEQYVIRGLNRAYSRGETVEAWLSGKNTMLGFKVVSPEYSMYKGFRPL